MHLQSALPPPLLTTSSSSKPVKITALPSWREKEMSNDIDSGKSNLIETKMIFVASFIALKIFR